MTAVLQTLPLGETGQRAELFLLLSYPDICIVSKAALPPDTSQLLTSSLFITNLTRYCFSLNSCLRPGRSIPWLTASAQEALGAMGGELLPRLQVPSAQRQEREHRPRVLSLRPG